MRASVPPSSRLPVYRDAFVGRGEEIGAIRARFDEGGRLVVLWGPGGVGKTRLACEHAARRAASGTPVVFVDLARAESVVELCRALSAALGAPLDRGIEPEDLIVDVGDALAAQGETLLVLDNLERVVDAAAQALPRWLDEAPRLSVLATTRARLGLRGEATIPLGPLATRSPDPAQAEAAQLFLARAHASRPSFRIATDADRAELGELLSRLDGMPLAIELAAARTSVLSLHDLVSGLEQRFTWLRTSSREVPDRQRTLEATIRWSWDLLGDEERAVLAQCVVFRGGFTLEAARAVLRIEDAPELDVLDPLERLVDRSLLRTEEAETGLRFRVYESIERFVLDQRPPGDELRRRHAEWVVAWSRGTSEPASSRERGLSRARVASELENLLAALGWAVGASDPRASLLALGAALALGSVFGLEGPNASYLDVFERAVARFDAAPAPGPRAEALFAQALASRAEARIRHGLVAGARADLERAGRLAEAAGDPAVASRVALAAADEAFAEGLLEQTVERGEHARALAEGAGERWLEARALDVLARTAVLRGELDRATELAEGALDRYRSLGDEEGVLRALLVQAETAMDRGELSRARQLHHRVLEGARARGDVRLANAAHLSIAALDEADGHFEEADARFAECVEEMRRVGVRGAESLGLAYRAACLEQAGRAGEARAVYDEALRVARASGNRLVEGLALAWLGRLAADQDQREEAERHLDRGAALLSEIGDDVRRDVVEICRGHLELARARALRASRPAEAERIERATAERVARLREEGRRPSWDVRRAAALLERALGRTPEAGATRPMAGADPITVARDGRWFRAASGAVVDLARHGALRLILAALVGRHVAAPGSAISVDALFAAGWPGQRAHPRSVATRVYTAVATLRRLGLREVLVRHHEGYLLEARVGIEVTDGPLPS